MGRFSKSKCWIRKEKQTKTNWFGYHKGNVSVFICSRLDDVFVSLASECVCHPKLSMSDAVAVYISCLFKFVQQQKTV